MAKKPADKTPKNVASVVDSQDGKSGKSAKPGNKASKAETAVYPTEAECLTALPTLSTDEEKPNSANPVQASSSAEPINLPPAIESEPQPDWDSTQFMSEPAWEPPVASGEQSTANACAVRNQSPLYIVQISPELAPVAKVGGLADVVFGLSNELALCGNDVEIILPKYDCLRYDLVWGLAECHADLWVPWFGGSIHCTVFSGQVHGRKCFFIEPHSADNFFNRGCVYGFNDDVLRFAFFSRAAMEFLWKSGRQPDIIHQGEFVLPIFSCDANELGAAAGQRRDRRV